MKTILIAEDDPVLANIIKDALEIKGFTAMVASDGADALNLFNSVAFDLAVLDIMMPKMNGYDVARNIRKSNELVPIVFLSAKSQTIDVLKGFETGANDYIRKPFSIDELVVRINALIKKQPTITLDVTEQTFSPTINKEDFVFMKDGNTLIKVNFIDITYIEADRDYSNLYRGKNKTLISSHLKEIEAMLPKNQFLRVHRSFIVSKNAIVAIRGNSINIGDKELPIGSNYKSAVLEALGI